MALKDVLLEDLKQSMKSKNEIRKDTVQLIRSEILQFEKDNRVILDDDGIIDIISKTLKARKNALPEFEKSGRQDLIDKLNTEINIILEFLPKQLTAEELEVIVKEAIQITGVTSIKETGIIMKEVMPKIKGKADGKAVNEILKKLL